MFQMGVEAVLGDAEKKIIPVMFRKTTWVRFDCPEILSKVEFKSNGLI